MQWPKSDINSFFLTDISFKEYVHIYVDIYYELARCKKSTCRKRFLHVWKNFTTTGVKAAHGILGFLRYSERDNCFHKNPSCLPRPKNRFLTKAEISGAIGNIFQSLIHLPWKGAKKRHIPSNCGVSCNQMVKLV